MSLTAGQLNSSLSDFSSEKKEAWCVAMGNMKPFKPYVKKQLGLYSMGFLGSLFRFLIAFRAGRDYVTSFIGIDFDRYTQSRQGPPTAETGFEPYLRDRLRCKFGVNLFAQKKVQPSKILRDCTYSYHGDFFCGLSRAFQSISVNPKCTV
ncbi:hypothetical protein [Paenibacillus montanisoli]|uniref:hypothetical protein n=1 Tax=Paenibacillus montanisoli TaxID=2081970 RepID=UPI0014023D64|nr:hypothetical protein [Paenibacillus montanisoli]